jgi:hypothetical protein
MHEHSTRHDASAARTAKPARVPQDSDLSAAGNRAVAEVLDARPVQRWPDLDDLPSMPSMPDLGGYMPSMPSLNIPGVNLNVDTDAGTASGGIDFHDGTSAQASYGANGLDASGQMGSTSVQGHANAVDDWAVAGATTTSGGTQLGGSFGDQQGRFGGGLSAKGANGDQGGIGGAFGGGGPLSGFGSYAGQYGNLDLGF